MIAIIGCGASGMMAAISAARAGKKVTILEHNDKPGRKLAVTGNGKCNLLNENREPGNYRSQDSRFVESVFAAFSAVDEIAFLREIGIPVRNKRGYYYPHSETAASVVAAFAEEMERLRVRVLYGAEVTKVSPLTADVNGYRIEYTIAQDSRQMYAESVIFACGGPAGDHLGAGDFGFRELRRLGLTVSEPHPALVPLLLSNKNAKTVSGVRLDAEVTIDTAGESNDLPEAGSEKGISSGLGLPKTEFGEVVWTDYGISGIPVMQLSRFAEEALSCGKKVLIRLNFLRDMSNEEALREVMRRTQEEAFSERDIEHAMDGLVPSKLMYVILFRAGVSPQKPAREITPDEARRIHKELTDMTLPVTGTRPFAYAQAARGGVSLSEINPDTCECVRFPGLYVTGELLDMDGNCGGYNLQWAFATGAIAGRNA